MPPAPIRQEWLNRFARIGKAVANPNRLELLEILAKGEHSVDSLARAAGLSAANTSQHLQQLRKGGLVAATKRAQHVYYRVSDPVVLELLNTLQQAAERCLDRPR